MVSKTGFELTHYPVQSKALYRLGYSDKEKNGAVDGN